MRGVSQRLRPHGEAGRGGRRRCRRPSTASTANHSPSTRICSIRDSRRVRRARRRQCAIIMGCPTYMGSPSADMKRFMEASSGRWMEQKWADKLAAGFTNSGSQNGDKQNTLVDIATFRGPARHGLDQPEPHARQQQLGRQRRRSQPSGLVAGRHGAVKRRRRSRQMPDAGGPRNGEDGLASA